MAWPDETEFTEFLQAAGLLARPLTSLQSLLDLQGALDAAVEWWDESTGYWPFLSTGIDETRPYTPPGGPILDLDTGILSITSLATNVTYSDSQGSALTSGLHYRFLPRNAPQRKIPYTAIEFIFWPSFLWPSDIEITGKWGYCLAADLPKSARIAVMAQAALSLLPLILAHLAQGLLRWTEGDVTKEFADPLKVRAGWEALVTYGLKQFKRPRANFG